MSDPDGPLTREDAHSHLEGIDLERAIDDALAYLFTPGGREAAAALFTKDPQRGLVTLAAVGAIAGLLTSALAAGHRDHDPPCPLCPDNLAATIRSALVARVPLVAYEVDALYDRLDAEGDG